jgi:hypothetical protein
MGKQLGVRQMPQAAASFGHGIHFSSNVVEQRDLGAMAMVDCLETKETSRWSTGRGGHFPLPPYYSDIVRGVVDCCFLNIK